MKLADRGQRDVSSDESAPAGDHLRRGPWTVEEDLLLVNYIAAHGEGRWNALARCAGLKRTGKSCRLRWLNYLRPDLRRGNMTAQEQLLILELHSRWGNRWSKIAQHLPGRTDNEIKNYWRTRVQKHARQLGCDVGSQRFRDLVRYLWMPRLLERASPSAGDDDAFVTAPHHDAPPLLSAFFVDDVELSCTTSSSSMSTNEIQQQQQQLVSPPALVSNAAAESAPGGNSDAFTCDAWCQPPPQHTEYAGQLSAAGACCDWSDESLLVPGLAGVYGDMMGKGLPELGETMWGSGADDLWYTQIMGL